MYQQPLTQAVSTKQFFRSLEISREDDRKLTSRDVLIMMVQVVATLAICWALHVLCT